MSIDLEIIGKIVGVITTIIAPFLIIYKWISAKLKRIEILEVKVNKQDESMQESKEEREILLQGVLCSLKGLQQLGCNHEVTDGIKQIESYLIKK